MRSSGVGFLPALAALSWALAAAPAPAEGSAATLQAVVLAFEGPNGAYARNLVVRSVGDALDLVPRKEVEATARERDADLGTAAGMAAVARAHGIDVFIAGRVRGRGASARVQMVAHGADGERIASGEVRVPPTAQGRRALQRAASRLADEAIEAVATRQPSPAAASAEAEAETEAEETSQEEADGSAGREATPSSRATPHVTILTGVGGRTRRAEVALASGDRRQYQSGVFLEIPVHVDIRPLAHRDRPAAEGFTVQMDFAMAVALSSVEQGQTESIDTQAYRFGVRTGYVHPFPWGALGVLAGYRHEVFDLGPNPVMPSSAYPMLQAGLVGRYDILGPLLFAQLEAGYRHLWRLGDLADAFGADAGGMGFDVHLTVGGAHASGFTYALRFGFEQHFLRFDGDASVASAQEGHDRGVAMGALLGWGF